MEYEDVEERQTAADELLSENLGLRSLAMEVNGTSNKNRWIALGYLQCCEFSHLFNSLKITSISSVVSNSQQVHLNLSSHICIISLFLDSS